jgi:hypothetical protein
MNHVDKFVCSSALQEYTKLIEETQGFRVKVDTTEVALLISQVSKYYTEVACFV